MANGYSDLVGSYLFRDQPERLIDRHLALGVSMGGHSVWQLMFAEPRVSAAVVVVGCPDFTSELCFTPICGLTLTIDLRSHLGPRKTVKTSHSVVGGG
jgi:hypothetical protein